jgi:DNA repair exonuclease SbcCD ATPase subunit
LVSDSEQPDVLAFEELQQLIRALGDEMAAWRRRAHEAEARLKELTPPPGAAAPIMPGRVRELEQENDELRQRLEAARQRTKQLVDRMRFLRQQHELGAER